MIIVHIFKIHLYFTASPTQKYTEISKIRLDKIKKNKNSKPDNKIHFSFLNLYIYIIIFIKK